MADLWDRVGIKPYTVDVSKAKLNLEEPKPKPTQKAPQPLPDNVFTKDGFLNDVSRGIAQTGLNYLNIGAQGLNNLGANIDRSTFTDTLSKLQQAQQESDTRVLSPTQLAEQKKIQEQMKNAKGFVENVQAGAKAAVNMFAHPIDNAGKIVGGLFDPINVVPFGAGKIAGLTANALGGARLARIGAGSVAGAVTNAPVNAVQEGLFANARGEDGIKAAEGAFGGGLAGGAVLGAVHPIFSKNFDNEIIGSKDGIDFTQTARETTQAQDGTYKQFYAPDSFYAKVYDTFTNHDGNENDLQKKLGSIADDEVQNIVGQKLIGWMDGKTQQATQEQAQVNEQTQFLLQSGADAKTIQATLDNVVTPDKEDLAVSSMLNNNKPLPSRMSGMRIFPLLESSIQTAQNMPQLARTNKEFYDVLLQNGMDKDLATVMTNAYAAKDPSILQEHIQQTLATNAPKLIDHQAIKTEVENSVQEVAQNFKPVEKNPISFEERKKSIANYWNSANEQERSNMMDDYWNDEQKKDENILPKGYEYFKIRDLKNSGKIEVQGKPIVLDGGFKGFIHKFEYGYAVSEPETGLRYGVGKTQSKAIDAVNELINRHGVEKVQSLIDSNKDHFLLEDNKDIAKAQYDIQTPQQRVSYWKEKYINEIGDIKKPEVFDEYSNKSFDDLSKEEQGIYTKKLLSNSKIISKGENTDEQVQHLPSNINDRGETSTSGSLRADEGSFTGGESNPNTPTITRAQASDSHVIQEVRNTQPDTRSDSINDGISKEPQAVERHTTAGSNDANTPRSRLDTLVPNDAKHSDGVNYDLRDKQPIILTRGERRSTNEKAKELLKRGAPFSESEKDTLRQYTGEGGLVSSKESLTQHYTPYQTIKAMYSAIDNSGYKYKKALEPAVGSGNFLGHRPELDWTTVDIDKTNHEVVKALYPKAKHYHNGFEEYRGKDFDLVISNVPFLEERGAGQIKDRPDIKMLHDYYFAAGLDKVKDNGIVAFVTSKGTMDKSDSKIRKELMSKGDIIGAYRLPSGTFSKNAHTDVVTDVIFLQKRPDGVAPHAHRVADNKAFETSSKTDDGLYLNDYFKNHTQNILGDMKIGVDKHYGRPAYEISGTPDYSKMKIEYKPYDKNIQEVVNSQDTPRDSQEFKNWADENGIEHSHYAGEPIVIDHANVMTRNEVKHSDVDKSSYYYTPVENKTIADKILALDKIKDAGEHNDLKLGKKLIEQYKDNFKIAPRKDKALAKAMRGFGADQKFTELSSFFNDKFEPADIFSEKTRYEGSGKADVTKNSPLSQRLFASEDNRGIVDVKNSALIDPKDFSKIVDSKEYSYIGENKFQNSILYYSGNVYDKIDSARSLLENADSAIVKKITEQIKALEEITPVQKTIDEISFKGVEPWIESAGIEIPFKKIEKWRNLPNGQGQQRTTEWASSFGEVFNNFLNGKQLIKMKDDESLASFKNRLRNASQEVSEKLDKYRDWLVRTGKAENFVRAYNKRFNGYVEPDYEKAAYLIQNTLDALPSDLSLRSNQIKWIMQAYYEGKGINAHDVGGGKTLAGVVLAKVLKDKGVAKKPLFVVPSKVIKNWVKEIQRAVPDAKIVDLGNLSKEKREQQLYDLANKNADYILISKEGFENLKLPSDIEANYARELLNENLHNDNLKGQQKEKMQEYLNKYLAVLAAENNNPSIALDKLGIDAIIADEARSYKNIGVSSDLVSNKLGKAFGLNLNKKNGSVSIDSATAYDFRFKTRYISEKNNGKNIFLLDATPTPNKPIEIYTMLKHLDNKIFDEYGIQTDRDFANMFFEFGIKPTKTGGLDKGLIALKNAYGLKGIMNRYVSRISMDDFASQKIIELPDTKVVEHYLDLSEEGERVFEDIASRMREAKSNRDKRNEITGIFSNGVTASVDPRLYQRMQIKELFDPTPQNSRVEKAIEQVLARRSLDSKAGQILFLDNAGHTASSISKMKDEAGHEIELDPTLKKNLHQKIKDKLIASGKYKANEVAIISGKEITDIKTGKESSASGNKAQQLKQDIVNAYDKGQVKVIIGTTKSAGEGMNIQKFTTDIYHLDLPWTVAEVIQRNGRGVRYGNEYKTVNVHYFFQSGTFDALMYKTVMNKKGWNEALWDSEVKDRIEVVDEGGSMPTPAEIMLAMEKDPIKRRQLELEIEHQRLSEEYSNVRDEVSTAQRKIKSLQQTLNDEIKKQAELSERMKSDSPTEAIKELRKKSLENPKDLKKYETQIKEALDRSRAAMDGYHASRVERISKLEKEIQKTDKYLADAKGNLMTVTNDLHLFEDKYMDERGNFIAETEC